MAPGVDPGFFYSVLLIYYWQNLESTQKLGAYNIQLYLILKFNVKDFYYPVFYFRKQLNQLYRFFLSVRIFT